MIPGRRAMVWREADSWFIRGVLLVRSFVSEGHTVRIGSREARFGISVNATSSFLRAGNLAGD